MYTPLELLALGEDDGSYGAAAREESRNTLLDEAAPEPPRERAFAMAARALVKGPVMA
jgi:hypothetical protein